MKAEQEIHGRAFQPAIYYFPVFVFRFARFFAAPELRIRNLKKSAVRLLIEFRNLKVT